MTGRLWSFIQKAETALRERWPLRTALYALIAAALLFAWFYAGDSGVAFVYNEF